MNLRLAGLLGAGVLALVLVVRPSDAVAPLPPFPLPALDETGLPPLPVESPRIANYTIEARLDTERHELDGRLTLEWRNTSAAAVSSFPFHLYWNAFLDNRSTLARGERRREPVAPRDDAQRARRHAFQQVGELRFCDDVGCADVLPSLRFTAPDDGNADDRTVFEVTSPRPIAPGGSARFEIAWKGRLPHGEMGRFGWVHDYNFVVQWFPKIGVLEATGWNCHQHHANTEFFADFGNYDVKLTVPEGFVVGATGTAQGEPVRNPDGTLTHRYTQNDVHDFAWTCSRRFVERRARFEEAGYPPVDIRVLVQPEHEALWGRYVNGTRTCLRAYGNWGAPYPYGHVTVVDPAWTSGSGGMEYPTLFTGGANFSSPLELQAPESVTVHECGHQFWYGLVATNEFEEGWLDEGLNEYHNNKADRLAFGPAGLGTRYLAFRSAGRTRGGFAWVAPGVNVERGRANLADLRDNGRVDPMVRRGWEYRTPRSYTFNTYRKPAQVFETLEGLLGDELMTRVTRTYARRHRFGHPRTADFIAVVNDVTGQDWRWFFDETFYSNELVDYAVEVKAKSLGTKLGFDSVQPGTPARLVDAAKGKPEPETTVDLVRLGGARLPVELLVEFEDGTLRYEQWDGREPWKRFRYHGVELKRATVDPRGKLALDVDRTNNVWQAERGAAARAASKWSLRFLLWIQNLLELQAVFA